MTFQTISLINTKGHVLTGEFVCETSNAWQVAVGGTVQVALKSEWTPKPVVPDFGNIFGGMR